LLEHVEALRVAMRHVQSSHPFEIVAMVVMPDHLHGIWALPEKDADYATRWSLIKSGFSRRVARNESISRSRARKRERGIWQRRYWEHQIRDDEDLRRHVDYIHYNPVKHGYVSRTVDWPHSSLHLYIRRGWLTAEWATGKAVAAGGFGER